MRSDEVIEQALKKTGLPVKYYEYSGTEEKYIVYNEEAEEAANHGDNRPQDKITWWQVHVFAPKASDFRLCKKEVIGRLKEAGFYVTDINTLYEKETKTIHVVICCHIGEQED